MEKLRIKRGKLLSQLTFLLRCRDYDTIPTCVKVIHHVKSLAAQRIMKQASRALLRERIHHTRRELDFLSRDLMALHLEVSANMDPELWSTVDYLSTAKADRESEQAKTIQMAKFDRLFNSQHPPRPVIAVEKVVINASSTPLDEASKTVLAKGMNFALAPKRIPKEEIICSVEASIRQLPEDTALSLRNATAAILKKANPPRANINREERMALMALKNNKNLKILPADKGNATVVMDSEDYKRKVTELLSQSEYQKVKRDPTKKIERRIAEALKTSSIPPAERKSLLRSDPRIPTLYCLPKIHKPGMPLRPIVSAVGSVTHPLAKHLTKHLNTVVGKTESFIKNSKHFVEKLQEISVKPDDILVSFDVQSLFTKVPVNEAINLVKEEFKKASIPEDLADLIEVCATSTYFKFDGEFYEQRDGAAMGSPISPGLANLFMEHFETRAINSSVAKPKVWYRYVDDIFAIWPHGEAELSKFLMHLNNQHPNIKFTVEKEQNGCLPFLDVLVYKKSNGRLGHRVYRKPTHTDRYLNADSHHHPAQKQAVIHTLVHRAREICEEESLGIELRTLKEALEKNGFTKRDIEKAIHKTAQPKKDKEPRDFAGKIILPYIQGCTDTIARVFRKENFQVIFTAPSKIEGLFPKSKESPSSLETPGVYQIPCSCGSSYIGQTGRNISTRVKEHFRCLKNNQPEKSAVAEHAITTGHDLDFSNTKVLARCQNFWPRLFREAIEINKHPNNFNRDKGIQLSTTWSTIINNPYFPSIRGQPVSGIQTSPSQPHTQHIQTMSTSLSLPNSTSPSMPPSINS